LKLSTPPASEVDAARSKRRSKRITSDRPLWLIWPNIAAVALIVAIPFLIALYTSFLSVDQYTLRQWTSAPWVGLDNYVEAVTGSSILSISALGSLGVSVAFSVLTTAIITPIGILAALTVNTEFRGRALIRSLYLIPYVIPTFVTAILWRTMFLPETGLINRLLAALGVADLNTYWLVGSKAFWAMLITECWAVWAFVYIMVLAGLQAIPVELYEVAELDGANSWQKLTKVVLPQLRGLLALALLLSTLFHFNNFTLPFVMFGTHPPAAVTVLPLNIYLTSFNLFNFSLGSAMSIFTLIIMLVPGFIYLRMLRLGEVAR
jgi:multiple sugar transport system permease protein